MKKIIVIACVLACFAASLFLFAADHIDSPAVTGTGSDITDYYAFVSPENDDNIVFVVNVQGLMAPSETAEASFDEEVMLEVNIDNSATKDNMEDLVIQAAFNNGKLMVYGPVPPVEKGLASTLVNSAAPVEVEVTPYGSDAKLTSTNGMKIFAGPRDDPFFFDLNAYKAVIAGTATSFNDPGADTFAGTNVMSVVIEVPKSMLGSGSINTWITSNRKM